MAARRASVRAARLWHRSWGSSACFGSKTLQRAVRNKLKTPWKELFAYSVFQCTVRRREVERYTHVYIYNIHEILRWIDLFYEAYPGSWSQIFKNQPETCAELTISQENYLLLIPTVVEVQQTFFSTVLCSLLSLAASVSS